MKVFASIILSLSIVLASCEQPKKATSVSSTDDSLFLLLTSRYKQIPNYSSRDTAKHLTNIFPLYSSYCIYKSDSICIDYYDNKARSIIGKPFPLFKLTYNNKLFLIPCDIVETSDTTHAFENEMNSFLSFRRSIYRKKVGYEKQTIHILDAMFADALEGRRVYPEDTLCLPNLAELAVQYHTKRTFEKIGKRFCKEYY